MKVDVDNIWSTRSTLHMRVHCWSDNTEWHHSYDVHVPLSTVAEEAVEAMWAYFNSTADAEPSDQPLF